ncbi:hypothetical protein L6452_19744 [Arctium lappa]|uniref:Uncharacterized protein n=1 Tax=Arctium lappa TaxID=4217 RepID=A0ACB9B8M4_ARCLA|nr:hypothetical protein L6452_19744 [Arctium lappa]
MEDVKNRSIFNLMMLCVRLKTHQIALCKLSSDPELSQIPNGLCDSALSDRRHIYGAHQLFTESKSIQCKRSNNIKKQDNSLVIHPPNVVPFSDEWLAAIEAAGEQEDDGTTLSEQLSSFVAEQSKMKIYVEQVSQLLTTEKNLRLQLTADGEKFQQFQDASVKSNVVSETFKQEIEKRLMLQPGEIGTPPAKVLCLTQVVT